MPKAGALRHAIILSAPALCPRLGHCGMQLYSVPQLYAQGWGTAACNYTQCPSSMPKAGALRHAIILSAPALCPRLGHCGMQLYSVPQLYAQGWGTAAYNYTQCPSSMPTAGALRYAIVLSAPALCPRLGRC